MRSLDTTATRTLATRDGETLAWAPECGVPQGEILSPFRFVALMDMLATWLTIRCNGGNPGKKSMGYCMPAPCQRLAGVIRGQGRPLAPTTRVHSMLYCDDICLVADSREDLQDMLGVVSELMKEMGIKVNPVKSYYTTNEDPPPEPHWNQYTLMANGEGGWKANGHQGAPRRSRRKQVRKRYATWGYISRWTGTGQPNTKYWRSASNAA